MKILIAGSPSKIFHLHEFGKALQIFNIKTKVVIDSEIYDGFPNRKISKWFQNKKQFKKLISEFKPDLIIVDRQRHFALAASELKIKLIILLRGDYWEEMKWAKETIYSSFFKKIILKKWEKMSNIVFKKSEFIIPICKYLESKTNDMIPNKKTFVMHQGINTKNWYPVVGPKLNHPCIGLVQSAVIWGKTKEMLILEEIIKSMPNVTFYWVGDGPYREKILSVLKKYDNFEWLGALQYPDKIREFLNEIDIYALVSGIDMSPLTLQEAQLMKKPVVVSNVGGVPEIMQNNITGFLIDKGDTKEWIKKLTLLISDKNMMTEMGNAGKEFVENNFSWDIIAKQFIDNLSKNGLMEKNEYKK